MDNSATATTPRTAARWQARWYLWDGGFLAMGSSHGVVPPHSHHAIQVTAGMDGMVGMKADGHEGGTWQGVMVAPDVEHQLEMRGTYVALLFIDPESREGRWLRRSLDRPLTEIPDAKLEPYLATLNTIRDAPMEAVETARAIHSAVRGLCSGPPPSQKLDPRVMRALEVIRSMDTRKISLEEVAGAVFLSPSRFAHIFSDTIGLPFRRYVLWRRLTRALSAVGRGHTLTAAAHSCGFSDSAHLTRACTQMFGQPPSIMLGPGEFHEIPAPFELGTG